MHEEELSDQFLIDAIAGRGMWALERLYYRYGQRFYALAYRMTADHMAAEELVQDAFLAIWQSAKLYAPRAGPVRNWLFSIIYHHTLDYLRSMRHRSTFQQVSWQEVEEYELFALSDIWEQVWSTVQSEELRDCLMQLPKKQLEVIEFAYFWGWTHTEIAQRCQIPLGTVKARIRLGVLHLRQALEQRGGENPPPHKMNSGQARPEQAARVVVQVTESACATGYELCREGLHRCFGYSEWEHLVDEIDAFEFRGATGSFIARKERRTRGHAYWYAYTWGHEGRRKTYLGRPAELTLARLEAMVRKLHNGMQAD